MSIDISESAIICYHQLICKNGISLEQYAYNLGINLENDGIHNGYKNCCIDEFISIENANINSHKNVSIGENAQNK